MALPLRCRPSPNPSSTTTYGLMLVGDLDGDEAADPGGTASPHAVTAAVASATLSSRP